MLPQNVVGEFDIDTLYHIVNSLSAPNQTILDVCPQGGVLFYYLFFFFHLVLLFLFNLIFWKGLLSLVAVLMGRNVLVGCPYLENAGEKLNKIIEDPVFESMKKKIAE